MRVYKKFGPLPFLIIIVAFGGLVVPTESSAVAPFLHTLF